MRKRFLLFLSLLAVWSKYSCGTLVIFEQAAESLTALNRVTLPGLFVAHYREEQLVAFPLMVSFAVIMSAVLRQDARQRALAEQDHLGQAFLFDRTDPSFRERVQIRTVSR